MRDEVAEESLGDKRELEELGKVAEGLHNGEKVSHLEIDVVDFCVSREC